MRLLATTEEEAVRCPEVLEIGALQAHVWECDFSPVSCSNVGLMMLLTSEMLNNNL